MSENQITDLAPKKAGRPKGTEKGNVFTERRITMDDDRWNYARKQPGGASKLFRDFIDQHRKQNAPE